MNYKFFVGCHHLQICVRNMGLDFEMLNAVANCLWVRQKWLIDSLIKVNFKAFVFIHVAWFYFGWAGEVAGCGFSENDWHTLTDCAGKSEFYTWDEPKIRLYAILAKRNHRNAESKAFITLPLGEYSANFFSASASIRVLIYIRREERAREWNMSCWYKIRNTRNTHKKHICMNEHQGAHIIIYFQVSNAKFIDLWSAINWSNVKKTEHTCGSPIAPSQPPPPPYARANRTKWMEFFVVVVVVDRRRWLEWNSLRS